MPGEPNLISKLRAQFPILQEQINGQPLVYLDNAATTQKPKQVIEQIQNYYLHNNANVHRASHSLSNRATALYEQARQRVAQFINAPDASEIVWTRGTTEGINLVANSWGKRLGADDEILISALEHHANIVPWQMLAAQSGAILKVIPLLDNGDLDLTAYEQLLNEKTRLVAVGHISNTLGTINPVAQMIEAAHAVGAKVLIDGAQAAPHLEIDVQLLGADFYLFSGHKVFAPTGIGALWARSEILHSMPPWQGGGEMIRKVSFTETTYNAPPSRFEAGTPDICGAIALGEALHWLQQQPRQQLLEHENQLFKYTLAGCEHIKGFQRVGQPNECASLFSFTLDGHHQQDVGLMLDQQGIAVRCGHHCAMPLMEQLELPGTIRTSFAFYNTQEDADRFLQALDHLVHPTQIPVEASVEHNDLLAEVSQLKGWNDRYRQIMQLGKKMPVLPEHEKTDKNLVPGCESKTWLSYSRDIHNRIHFRADSEARIIRGLVALVLSLVQDKTPEEIQQIDIYQLFTRLDLERHLSPSRGNGLRAVLEQIEQISHSAEI